MLCQLFWCFNLKKFGSKCEAWTITTHCKRWAIIAIVIMFRCARRLGLFSVVVAIVAYATRNCWQVQDIKRKYECKKFHSCKDKSWQAIFTIGLSKFSVCETRHGSNTYRSIDASSIQMELCVRLAISWRRKLLKEFLPFIALFMLLGLFLRKYKYNKALQILNIVSVCLVGKEVR